MTSDHMARVDATARALYAANTLAAINLAAGMPPEVAHVVLHHTPTAFEDLPDWGQRLWLATVANLEEHASKSPNRPPFTQHCPHCPAAKGFPEADPCTGVVVTPIV